MKTFPLLATLSASLRQNYRCFVGGSIGLLGRAVSEVVCTKEGETPRNPLLGR